MDQDSIVLLAGASFCCLVYRFAGWPILVVCHSPGRSVRLVASPSFVALRCPRHCRLAHRLAERLCWPVHRFAGWSIARLVWLVHRFAGWSITFLAAGPSLWRPVSRMAGWSTQACNQWIRTTVRNSLPSLSGALLPGLSSEMIVLGIRLTFSVFEVWARQDGWGW